jgi:hypothetical protein
MPRFRQHLAINVAALSLFEAAGQITAMNVNPEVRWDWGRFLLNVGTGSLAGMLPDLFEPSLGNPNHRGFCHSLAAAGLVWWLASGRHTSDFPVELRRLLAAVGMGYSLHLGADLFASKAKGMGVFNAQS